MRKIGSIVSKLNTTGRNTIPAPIVCCLCLTLMCMAGPSSAEDNLSLPNKDEQALSLQDTVALVLRHNRSIESNYLQRVSDRYGLRVAQDEFVPDLTLSGSAATQTQFDRSTRRHLRSNTYSLTPVAVLRIKTGGSFVASWDNQFVNVERDNDTVTSTFTLSFVQPLLKGGGIAVATANQKIAERNEVVSILGLKSTLMSTVTLAIQNYRALLQTQQQLEITRRSYERALSLVDINKALIEAGRMAQVEQVQAQADVARRELDVRTAEIALKRARLNLLRVLDIGQDLVFVPQTEKNLPVPPKNLNELLDLAFEHRPDYLSNLLQIENARSRLLVARNNRLWSLDFTSAYSSSGSDEFFGEATEDLTQYREGNVNAGIAVNIPIGDLTLRQGVVNAQVGLEQTRLAHDELTDEIRITVEDVLRDVEVQYAQVEIAERSRELAAQAVEIEREKLRAGRSSNFQLVSLQDSLVSAESAALNARISYLNSLTRLDAELGTTLKSWGIALVDRYQDPEDLNNREY